MVFDGPFTVQVNVAGLGSVTSDASFVNETEYSRGVGDGPRTGGATVGVRVGREIGLNGF